MATLFKSTDGSHWYSKQGEAQHDADLRVARKQLLYASPTTIDKSEFVNAFLNRWLKEQVVIACVDNPRFQSESLEDYAKRIEFLANTKSRVASDFGTKIHDACEHYPIVPLDITLMPWFNHFVTWYEANVDTTIQAEVVLVDNDIGVAGMTDRIVMMKDPNLGRAIVDYKTQGIKADDKGRKKPIFYPSWARQLSFYAGADAKKTGFWPTLPTCINLVIDSTEATPFYVKVWSREEIVDSYHDFVVAANRFYRSRSYWPCGEWSIKPQCPMPIL